MLDSVSLDQLRTFLAAVDQGSFSAAGRRLLRSQSAISEAIGTLEAHLGVSLFDRSARYPKLTEAGSVLVADARQVLSSVDGMKARARGMASGIEPELSVVVDVFFPMEALANAAKSFREIFPDTPLRLNTEALGAATQMVIDGRVGFGVAIHVPETTVELKTERLTQIEIVMVAAADHPLAAWPGPIPREELARHVQLVLTDRSQLTANREYAVFSATTWRLADLFAKHAFILNGLGWGGMPRHAVAADLKAGRLVELTLEDLNSQDLSVPISAVYRAASPPGPAGRWMIGQLMACPKSIS